MLVRGGHRRLIRLRQAGKCCVMVLTLCYAPGCCTSPPRRASGVACSPGPFVYYLMIGTKQKRSAVLLPRLRCCASLELEIDSEGLSPKVFDANARGQVSGQSAHSVLSLLPCE